MTINDFLIPLAPEFVLLVGAMIALTVGVLRGGGMSPLAAPVTFITVLAAFILSIRQGVPQADYLAGIGLWPTSLTYYTRCVALGVGTLIVLVNWHQPIARERGEYMAMIALSLLGVLLTASANDLVVLFFAIELVSVPTYVLIALSREDRRSSEATVKYFFLGALSAALLAYGLSFLYGATGTTSLYSFYDGAFLSHLPPSDTLGPLGLIGLLLVFGGLLFKIAAVPFHGYAADVYEGAASPVTGLLGFVPKFAGFVALIKVFAACGWDLPSSLMWLVWIVAVATMTIGNTLALLQKNAKRILAYSSIAHTGYMLIGLLVGPVAGTGPMHDGIAALLFYIAVYGAMNLGAFAFLASFRVGNRDVETLDDLGGMSRSAPAAALGLAICAFSLMGFPPTAGMMGKVYLFSSAFSLGLHHRFEGPLIALAIIAVLNTAVGAAYYLRIISAVYVGKPVDKPESSGGRPIRLGLVLCAAAMLVLFVRPWLLAKPARDATAVVQHTTHVDARTRSESSLLVSDPESQSGQAGARTVSADPLRRPSSSVQGPLNP